MTDFISLGSKITADGDYNHEIKRRLLLGRKAMANLDSGIFQVKVLTGVGCHCLLQRYGKYIQRFKDGKKQEDVA